MRDIFAQILVGMMLITSLAQAQLQDVQISATRKKLDEQKSRGSNETVTNTEIAYNVTVTGRSFKPLPDVEIKYMIFYEDAEPGSKEKPTLRHVKGKELVGTLENNRPVTFETSPVKLGKTELDGNWYYGSGASNRAKDAVAGLWFRAYSAGKLVGEYVNPSSLPKKTDWKE